MIYGTKQMDIRDIYIREKWYLSMEYIVTYSGTLRRGLYAPNRIIDEKLEK